MSNYQSLMHNVHFPAMARVEQLFSTCVLANPEQALQDQLYAGDSPLADRIQPNMSIGITAGSRGIDHMPQLIRELVSICKKRGAKPFIFPAMGSHGGATAEGQISVLKSFGITEEFCGCPIRATMGTVLIGRTPEHEPVYLDQYAHDADGIIVINRIKPHTTFRGPYESGLMKMMTIGCGKQRGAAACHTHGFRYMHRLVPQCGAVVLENTNVLFGVGTIENSFDKIAQLHVLSPEAIITEEPKLLNIARSLMGKIYLDNIDLLIIDEIGKNISGGGADPNVSGHHVSEYISGGLNAQRRVILSLSEATHGNANGVGNFDCITKRVFDELDMTSTYANSITCTQLHSAKIPMIMESDREAIMLGLYSCLEGDPNNPRVIRIKNTAELKEIWVSEALLPEVEKNPNLKLLSSPEPFAFNDKGNLF